MSSQVVAEFGWRGIAESESLGAGERHGEKQRRKYDWIFWVYRLVLLLVEVEEAGPFHGMAKDVGC